LNAKDLISKWLGESQQHSNMASNYNTASNDLMSQVEVAVSSAIVSCANELEDALGVVESAPSAIHNTGSLKLLERCRDYIEGVSGRSIAGDQLLLELIEQLQAGA